MDGGQELGRRLATVRRAHLLPQRDGGADRSRARASSTPMRSASVSWVRLLGSVNITLVSLPPRSPASWTPWRWTAPTAPDWSPSAATRARAHVRAGREISAQHGGQLVIGGLDLVQQSRVNGDLAARHAPGVDLVAGQHVHFPFPARRIGPEYAGLRDQPLRDRAGARHCAGSRSSRFLALACFRMSPYCWPASCSSAWAGTMLDMRAVDADGARLRGVHARATRQHGKGGPQGAHGRENPTHEDLRSAIMAAGRQAYQTETSAHCAR